MSIPKSSWRKPPKSKKGAVIRTRPIFQAAFPAVKNHTIQRGSVRTICPCKWPNRTAKGGAWATLLPVPTHAPPGHSCDSYFLTKFNGDCCSDTPRQSSKQTYNSNKKSGCCQERLHPLINYLDLYLSISSRILTKLRACIVYSFRGYRFPLFQEDYPELRDGLAAAGNT